MNYLRAMMRRVGLEKPRARWRLTGPFRAITGYDRVVRAIVPRLRERGVALELHELRNWSPTRSTDKLPHSFENRQKLKTADLHLHFGLPTQVRCSSDCRNINYSMFEASRIPASWAKAAEAHSLILVPTESSRQSWMAGGVPEDKVRVCPEGVDFDTFSPGVRPLRLQTREGRAASSFRYRFLNVSEMITRKNILGLLRVWLRATSSAADCVLMLKPGFYVKGSREILQAGMRSLEIEEGKTFEEAAPIILVDRQLADSEVPRLYAAATHYWSMSFGEGFDLPMMEATASDLQLIAPFHSAYRHYLSEEIAILIPAEETNAVILDDAGLSGLFQGSRWWRPNATRAEEVIRRIVAGEAAPHASARNRLRASCRWEDMVDCLLKELG